MRETDVTWPNRFGSRKENPTARKPGLVVVQAVAGSSPVAHLTVGCLVLLLFRAEQVRVLFGIACVEATLLGLAIGTLIAIGVELARTGEQRLALA